MQAQKDHYLAELDNQREYYDGELVKQENEFTSQIEQIKKDYENLISTLKQKQLDEISSFKERITNEKNESIRNKQSEIDQLNEKISNLTAELASFKEENKLLKVKINGLLVKTGQAEPAEEMITEEKFNELEKTKIAFDNYYKLAWKKAKEAIRKEALAIRKKKDK
jgi:vacuolar-type H+-ATPase subunit H